MASLREARIRYEKAHHAYVIAFDPTEEQLAELEAAAAEYGAAEEAAMPVMLRQEENNGHRVQGSYEAATSTDCL